jgi:hypothetical protein
MIPRLHVTQRSRRPSSLLRVPNEHKRKRWPRHFRALRLCTIHKGERPMSRQGLLYLVLRLILQGVRMRANARVLRVREGMSSRLRGGMKIRGRRLRMSARLLIRVGIRGMGVGMRPGLVRGIPGSRNHMLLLGITANRARRIHFRIRVLRLGLGRGQGQGRLLVRLQLRTLLRPGMQRIRHTRRTHRGRHSLGMNTRRMGPSSSSSSSMRVRMGTRIMIRRRVRVDLDPGQDRLMDMPSRRIILLHNLLHGTRQPLSRNRNPRRMSITIVMVGTLITRTRRVRVL